MPPAKKQKTSKESSAPTQEKEAESATPHKNDGKSRDPDTIPPYEYVCIHRPFFDYKAENLAAGEEALELDKLGEKYEEGFNKEIKSGVILQPAKDHPEWKWTFIWEGFEMFNEYERRSNYCNPDMFDMYICNDWNGWGQMELVENMILAFDAALKKKGDDALKQMWAVISALAIWLNKDESHGFIDSDDGEKTRAMSGLVGYALLRALAGLDHAEEIKADTEFFDIPLVITLFLEWSSDLEEYGIEDEAVEWRPHAAAYFKKGKFEASKGVARTAKLVEEAKPTEEDKLPKKTRKDPWTWSKRLKDFKSLYGTPKIGGTRYDITKMTREKRASYAFDGKDPLKDISDKDLKEGLLDFE